MNAMVILFISTLLIFFYCDLCLAWEGDEEVRTLTEPRIWAHRTGSIIIEATPGTTVHVEQLRHEFRFGSALSTKVFDGRYEGEEREKYLSIFVKNFNSAVYENAFKWHKSEPQHGKPFWEHVDAMLQFCEENDIPIRGHCLYWAAEKYVPKWVKDITDDQLEKAIVNRAREACGRYRGRIIDYDVNNEMVHNRYFVDRLGDEIVDVMFAEAHRSDPNAVLYVNDFEILSGNDLDEYIAQIQSLLGRKVPVGGIGCQGHFLGPEFPSPERLFESLDLLGRFGLPIKITEFDRLATDEASQAKDLDTFFRICFSHPAVEAILQWGFWENAHWKPEAALWRKDFSIKPAGEAYRNLVFNEWWTNETSQTDENGFCEVRAFFGKHRITVGEETKVLELRKSQGPLILLMDN